MITITQKGSFDSIEQYLNRVRSSNLFGILSKYGAMGVEVLSAATPVLSGKTSGAWTFDVFQRPGHYAIRWSNSNREYGTPVAILIQYGHGTKNGGYVEGIDYINPAMRPIFEKMTRDMVKEVTK